MCFFSLFIFCLFDQVRVAHFEPNKIILTGEGVFPRVIFDLPPDKEDFRYEELTQQARESLGREKSNLSEKTVDDVPFRALADVSTYARTFCILLISLVFAIQKHRVKQSNCNSCLPKIVPLNWRKYFVYSEVSTSIKNSRLANVICFDFYLTVALNNKRTFKKNFNHLNTGFPWNPYIKEL